MDSLTQLYQGWKYIFAHDTSIKIIHVIVGAMALPYDPNDIKLVEPPATKKLLEWHDEFIRVIESATLPPDTIFMFPTATPKETKTGAAYFDYSVKRSVIITNIKVPDVEG